ncbi:hypothetical protein LNP74_17690 [Klebsiella pneumoniae subsp. pneumoniae]|nr:hypothetical protein [Klebsiella pneumoniae subsp. pneumoniae]
MAAGKDRRPDRRADGAAGAGGALRDRYPHQLSGGQQQRVGGGAGAGGRSGGAVDG